MLIVPGIMLFGGAGVGYLGYRERADASADHVAAVLNAPAGTFDLTLEGITQERLRRATTEMYIGGAVAALGLVLLLAQVKRGR